LLKEEYYSDKSSANGSLNIFLCRPYSYLSCRGKWFMVNSSEFRFLNKTVFVNASRRQYNSSEYNWRSGLLFVCEKFDYHKPTLQPNEESVILSVLTFVSMVISIISLVFVLITYSLFSELRTPPGINLMNLSASILLAQLLWLVGSGQTDKPTTCTVIAVLLHYFFLVSFMWTSIIAFDTWRAFTVKGTKPLFDSKRKRLVYILRYMAIGWLSVMVYVAICVALDQSKFIFMGYGKDHACWIANKIAIVYFVAIPIVLMLTTNIAMYILTMIAIKTTAAQTRIAADPKDRKQLFWVHIKVASTMGFTWIFAFIAMAGLEFVWYPYVILSGLQGVYIAVAFRLNQRSRKLYKKLCCATADSEQKHAHAPRDGMKSASNTRELQM